jgi:hypothetical protein
LNVANAVQSAYVVSSQSNARVKTSGEYQTAATNTVRHRLRTTRLTELSASLLLCCFCSLAGFAATTTLTQFDVFPGYDDIVPDASWFPIVCEVKNDGPSFMGDVEVATDNNYGPGQARHMRVELPTGTLKRFTIPVFSTARGASWEVRLYDEHGKLRAEKVGLRPAKEVSSSTPILGALSRVPGSKPPVQPVTSQPLERQPPSAALLPAIFPDNPLVLEGMRSLYLSSEKAPDLKPNQVDALYSWLYDGGHLIVGVEQLTDIQSTKWLNNLFPVDLKDMKTVSRHSEIERWTKGITYDTNRAQINPQYQYNYPQPNRRKKSGKNLPPPVIGVTNPAAEAGLEGTTPTDDSKFENSPMQAAIGVLRDGKTVISAEASPLIVTAARGRGRITVLLFSPEREPFRSWKNLPTFWARVTDIPAGWYVAQQAGSMGGISSDGIFGAMLDSRQVHKLPVEWLLLLLIVYLVVIGPLDQYWLKKIGRPMLTWITFPCYVVMFSLLIYFIGYKLRAGESEWNELHVVDVLMNGDQAHLRGRTYASIYAPSNQRYLIQSPQRYATLRGEFFGYMGGSQSTEKATVVQNGDTFKAELFIPVWTSQLFVSDWWQPADAPLTATLDAKADGWDVKVDNKTEQKITDARVVIESRIFSLGQIAASESKTFHVSSDQGQGTGITNFVSNHAHNFQGVINSRQSAFGATERGRIDDLPNTTLAASFLSQVDNQESWMNTFVSPPGLDMSAEVARGAAILFAWAEDYSPVKPLYPSKPARTHKYTMFRLPITAK